MNFNISLTERMNFAERSKILLDTDLKIILIDRQIHFIGN